MTHSPCLTSGVKRAAQTPTRVRGTTVTDLFSCVTLKEAVFTQSQTFCIGYMFVQSRVIHCVFLLNLVEHITQKH